MTCLLRTRGSATEMARLFAAEAQPGLAWPESIWTGEQVPVIVADEGGARRLTTTTWGLPADAFAAHVGLKQRGVIYSRDLWRSGSRLADTATISRCLIVLEAFAYPMRKSGRCTRGWIGLQDRPLVAWAGVYANGGCAGVLIGANEMVEALGSNMPRLLASDDHAAWLEGGTLLSLGPPYADQDFYCENLDERWSSGRLSDEIPPLFAS